MTAQDAQIGRGVTGVRVDVDGSVTFPHASAGEVVAMLNTAVGGRVDVVRLPGEIDMWLRDDGLGVAETNPAASEVMGRLGGQPVVAGPVVFTGCTGGATRSLSDGQTDVLRGLPVAVGRALDVGVSPAELFVFDGDHHNTEQVRRFYPGYLRVRERLEAAGRYVYNADVVGEIDGLAGSATEDAGVYLLQTLHSLEQMRGQVAAFIARGGVDPDTLDWEHTTVRRGDVATYGFYMGGTGWQLREAVRLRRDDRGSFVLLGKGQRTGRRPAGRMLFIENGTSR